MNRLLCPEDPPPCGVEIPEGTSPILFVSDHADRAVPKQLGTLGLDPSELSRHIGYDIGIYGVTSQLARNLDASYIYQRYSRLVIDCNRQLRKPQSVLTQSDGTLVPGNADLSEEQIAAREDEIMRPYHARIESELQARIVAGRPTALFAMHSCTDRLLSDPRPRPWEISVIAGQDWRIADALLDVLRSDTKLCIGVNEPYTVDTDADYTVPVHAERQGIAYVEIEIRQDLIKDPDGQREWATLLSGVFPKAVAQSGILSK